jgi:hypothetical protein
MTKQLLVESSEIGLNFNSKRAKGLKAVKAIKESVKETLCQIADHLEEREAKISEMEGVITEAEATIEETQRLLKIATEVANALYKKLKSLEE